MSNLEQHNGSSLQFTSEIFDNLSLHLDDVEFLHNAFIVQAITGPLVRFSNRGRYEPYVAKSWRQAENSWFFQLHSNLKCEDGQLINPETFKESLKRSLRRFSIEEIEQTPFSALEGIKALINNNDDTNLGIRASGNELELRFTRPIGKALLEYLAMTPFAFLCESNFYNNEWKSRVEFISSGPYRVAKFDPQKNFCELELRKDWPLAPNRAFSSILISKEIVPSLKTTASILMTYGAQKKNSGVYNRVLEVPRALLSVRLGIEDDQYFFQRSNRKALQAELNKVLSATEIPFENYHRAESFFFGQVTGHELPIQADIHVSPPRIPLKIRGLPNGQRPEVDFYQNILFKTLDNLGWPYELNTKPIGTVKEFHNLRYDISFDRSHVDATLDPDFVRLLFKSKLGPKYQDPGQRVSKLVDDFDSGKLTYRDFLINFNSIIFEEAAILPLFHRGFVWEFSDNIDTRQIGPLMSILRYEELVLKDNDIH